MKISVCIPAYNRVEFLFPLLDSIRKQTSQPDEVVICEDVSPQREDIKNAITQYRLQHPSFPITLHLNDENLGYDANFRRLLECSSGDYCLFMGNDDLLQPLAIERIRKAVLENPNIGVISRAYSWFSGEKDNIQDTVRHLDDDTLFEPGVESIRFFYRRMGVLSGLVFKREPCLKIAVDKYDGHLYYQMYLAGSLLKEYQGFYLSDVQTLSRDGIEPDFGNAKNEKKKFTPGSFGYEGRVYMVKGLLDIARDLDDDKNKMPIYNAVRSDIGNYFYPYIRDQLNLPFKVYCKMFFEFKKIGMGLHGFFILHFFIGFVFKRKGYDFIVRLIRRILGRSPRLGI
ncbi:glycosyltransferase family 2 protein [Kangiella sp.]|uniref:glycosyltransferase family 2 protein n=1 Tax=Kangiella sp. TaxID=1920245 RepID=UPI003A951C8E